MKRRDYERWIRLYGWRLVKSGWDWTLTDEQGHSLCTIKVTHPGGEVPAFHVRKTEKELQERGLLS